MSNNYNNNNKSIVRHLKLIRNETGYGFTLSRYITYSNDPQSTQQQIAKVSIVVS